MRHLLIVLAPAALLGCSSSGAPSSSAPPPGGDSGATDALPGSGATTTGQSASDGAAGAEAGSDFDASASDFDCFENNEWTQVGLSHYKNALGGAAAALAVARSTDGGTYPVGTVVQLNPVEVMVKRGQGFNASSNDWEFFTLNISDAGVVTITARGGGSSVSNSAGTCLGCHTPAQMPWDLICGDDPDGGPKTAHGCAPLPVPYAVLAAIVDPRCGSGDAGGAADASAADSAGSMDGGSSDAAGGSDSR
jgi:hypothetical protein